MRLYAILMLALGLLACDKPSNQTVIPPQQWDDIMITVETEPSPVLAGMNEFIIIVNDHLKGIRPAHDYLISLRTSSAYPWRQAMQDGHSGVYRRGIAVSSVKNAVLFMRIKSKKGETTLQFELDSAQKNNQKKPL